MTRPPLLHLMLISWIISLLLRFLLIFLARAGACPPGAGGPRLLNAAVFYRPAQTKRTKAYKKRQLMRRLKLICIFLYSFMMYSK
jgi:hypothetical protein